MPERVIIAAAKHSQRAYRATAKVWERGGPLAPLILKGALFGLLLLYVQRTGFAPWPVFLFLLVTVVSYMQPVFRTFSLSTSLFLMLSLSLLLTSRFTITLPAAMHASAFGELLFAGMFGSLFFVLLGIKNMVLVRRPQWYAVLFIALVYGISLLFFTSGVTSSIWQGVLLLGLFTYLLFREYFRVQDHAKSRALKVIGLCLTLLVIELAWVIGLLPLGFSKSASVLTLMTMMAAGITDRYLRGTLTARFLRLSLGLVVVLTTVIFLSARWTI